MRLKNGLFKETRICNRWIQLKGLHPCITSNSNHVMNHLRDYNCSVRTYPHRISCMTNCTVVTFQIIHFMVWIGWQQGCQHVSWICLLWQTTRGVNNKHISWGGWTSPPPPREHLVLFLQSLELIQVLFCCNFHFEPLICNVCNNNIFVISVHALYLFSGCFDILLNRQK